MKLFFKNTLAFFIFFSFPIIYSQENDTIKKNTLDLELEEGYEKEQDSILYKLYGREIVVSPNGVVTLSEDEKARLILRKRIFRTYPYARIASDRLTALNANLAKLKTEKEKKKYFKLVEKYLEEEFEKKLKNLSKKDGQILVKLIHRQTGSTTYDLIKELKSGWKAFWSNSTAKLFDINLKTPYDPYNVLEDFNIESLLLTAFDEGTLVRQDSKVPIDLTKLVATWKARTEKAKENKDVKD